MTRAIDRYPVNQLDQEKRAAERIRELERRIEELERRHFAGRDAAMTVTDENGVRVLIIGKQFDDNAAITIWDTNGEVARIGVGGWGSLAHGFTEGRIITVKSTAGTLKFLCDAAQGLIWPPILSPWSRLGETVVTASATFFSMWATETVISTDSVQVHAFCTVPAGTTGEVRVLESVSGFVTAAQVIASGASQFYTFQWQHGIAANANAAFIVQARVTGGAGSVTVNLPPPLQQHDNLINGGVTDGVI